MKLKNKANLLISEHREGPAPQRIDICSIYQESALIRRKQSAHNLQQRALSRTALANNAYNLARPNREPYPLENVQVTNFIINLRRMLYGRDALFPILILSSPPACISKGLPSPIAALP